MESKPDLKVVVDNSDKFTERVDARASDKWTTRPAFTSRFTDLGNAEQLVAYYGRALRFVVDWDAWVYWTGRRWESGRLGVDRYAKKTARVLIGAAKEALVEAERLGDEKAIDDAKQAYAWAVKSHDAARIAAAVKLASSAEEIDVKSSRLNADPMLLTVRNGTIELATGKLREWRSTDLITKMAAVRFDAKAKCPLWDRFVLDAMGGRKELVAYLQRFVGYSLTGSTEEQCLAFFYGDGRNGKSTFLNTIYRMLGDYAAKAPRKFLLETKSERHPTEIVPLFGARFVMCHEIGGQARFDEQLLKDVTGSDPLTARRMHENNWEFEPTHTLFMYGNDKPKIRGRDEGIWRRIRLIPWTVQIDKKKIDAKLPERLARELPGILNWAIRGCLEWQRSGLSTPNVVEAATEAYREETDPFGDFFKRRCVFGLDERVTRQALRKAYEKFCATEGIQYVAGPRTLAEALYRRDVRATTIREKGGVFDGWRGVGLATVGT
jgi:putative DNA primase/helicase